MPVVPYTVALASRGAGAFAYSYTGPPDLARGQLAAVRFRGSLELGVVLEVDTAPPAGVALQALWPLQCSIKGWGELLLELCEFACAAPDELLPRLSLTGSSNGLRLVLIRQDPAALPAKLQAQLEACSGVLTPTKRKLLAKSALWDPAVELGLAGVVELRLDFAGQPGVTSAKAALRQWYQLDSAQRGLLGLGHSAEQWWPGGYLAGLAEPPELGALPKRTSLPPRSSAASPDVDVAGQHNGALSWQLLPFPPEWNMALCWPRIAALPLRRAHCSWPELRSPDGLPAELARAVASGERVLLIAPQAWLLDRLWPQFDAITAHVLRYDAALTASKLANLLFCVGAAGGRPSAREPEERASADAPTRVPTGLVVAGSEAAWRLAVYADFDRVILLDPSHPQWQPEGAPHLDPRGALLLALARRGRPGSSPQLDIVEFGLSAFDGQLQPTLYILPPHDPADAPPMEPGTVPADTNPLPLELRQPNVRKLVYFNRLGASRGLQCAECGTFVPCPNCGSRSLHYSGQRKRFVCPDCGLAERDLRCPQCGLGTLAARLPGLEAMRVRPGELLVQGANPALPGPETHAVLGTAQLLEPVAGFWPEQVVYVDPEERDVLGADWREALDMAARLTALYANPELRNTTVVSARLAGRLADKVVSPEQIAVECLLEGRLRKLGGLPPYGCLYHLRALATHPCPLPPVRELLGARLSQHPGTALLRLGKPFKRARRHELHGFLLNPQLTWAELQELRWEVNAQDATLGIAAGRGPWI